MARITIQAEGAEENYTLEATTVTLGRGLESDIRLKDIKASRRHCQIVKTPGGYKCLDLNSGNGTYVNGVQVKEQKLSPGDKIQIGTTIITFFDGAAAGAAPAPAKPATARAVAAPAAATGKVGDRSTRKLPVAAAVPAAGTSRAGTNKIPTAPTKIGVKPAIQSGAKTGTGSVKKITQRMGTARAVSASQRFHQEARKKKSNPIGVIIGIIAVAFLVSVGFILFGGGRSVEEVQAQIKHLTDRAFKADGEGKYDEAVALLKQALALVSDDKSSRLTMEGQIKEIEQRRDQYAAAERAFLDFKKKFQTAGDDQARQLWEEGQKLKQAYGEANVPWATELKEILEKVNNMINTQAATSRRNDFQVFRNDLIDRHKLNDRTGSAQWGPALREWKRYLGEVKSDDTRNKVNIEIENLENRAREEIDTLRRRAERDERGKAEAVDGLKQNRPRFDGTQAADLLEKVIKDIEAK
jgi:pSer/pThr/pTyr-binding forkhead associated (FHA) protein